jgi:hypothetical protein
MFMSYDLKLLIVELGRTEICDDFIVTLQSLRGCNCMITIMCTNVIHHIVHRMACLVLMCYGPRAHQVAVGHCSHVLL